MSVGGEGRVGELQKARGEEKEDREGMHLCREGREGGWEGG